MKAESASILVCTEKQNILYYNYCIESNREPRHQQFAGAFSNIYKNKVALYISCTYRISINYKGVNALWSKHCGFLWITETGT